MEDPPGKAASFARRRVGKPAVSGSEWRVEAEAWRVQRNEKESTVLRK
jgi:hypothetical protein